MSMSLPQGRRRAGDDGSPVSSCAGLGTGTGGCYSWLLGEPLKAASVTVPTWQACLESLSA